MPYHPPPECVHRSQDNVDVNIIHFLPSTCYSLTSFLPSLRSSRPTCHPFRYPLQNSRSTPTPISLHDSTTLTLPDGSRNPLDPLLSSIIPPLSRQAPLTCPNNSTQLCAPPQLCCPSFCCLPTLPFCLRTSCTDSLGRIRCVSENGTAALGSLCLNQRKVKCCGLNLSYPNCPLKDPVGYCLDDNGFMACGEDGQPGTSCGNKKCCRLPFVCCPTGCCKGSAIPHSLQPTPVNLTPAVSPITTPSPSTSSQSQVGHCPNSPRKCVNHTLCCPNDCCETEIPFCNSAGKCTDTEGRGRCLFKNDTKNFNIICHDDPDGSCCGHDPLYPFCVAEAPFNCVNRDGYMNCSSAPGIPCKNGHCCKNPEKCCGDTCCDEGGEGGPGKLQASPTGLVPASTPKGVIIDPTPSRSSKPAVSPSSSPSVPPSPSARPTRSSSPEPSEGPCFPGHATVELRDGSSCRIDQLETGQYVRVAAEEYSRVFMWTHRDHTFKARYYIRLSLENGRSFTASVGHMVYTCEGGVSDCGRDVVKVEDMKVGDGVWVALEDREVVMKIRGRELISSRGLFNPQTLHGDIVVDGVLSTCYTRVVPMRVAHSALAPLRAIYEMVEYAINTK